MSGGPEWAEPAGCGEAERAARLEAADVAAQHRDERLQDAPAWVTAVAGATIQSRQVTDVTGRRRVAPGLNIATFPPASPANPAPMASAPLASERGGI